MVLLLERENDCISRVCSLNGRELQVSLDEQGKAYHKLRSILQYSWSTNGDRVHCTTDRDGSERQKGNASDGREELHGKLT